VPLAADPGGPPPDRPTQGHTTHARGPPNLPHVPLTADRSGPARPPPVSRGHTLEVLTVSGGRPDERSPTVPAGPNSARSVTRNRTPEASEGRTSTRSSPPLAGPRPARAARRGSRRPPQSFDSRSTHSWGQVCGHLGSGGGRSASGPGFPAVVHRTRRSVPGSGDGGRPRSTAVPPVPPARTPVLHSAHRTYCHCCCFSLGEEQKTRVGERRPVRCCTGPECRTPLSGSTVTTTEDSARRTSDPGGQR
jgi:hypothetical protein